MNRGLFNDATMKELLSEEWKENFPFIRQKNLIV